LRGVVQSERLARQRLARQDLLEARVEARVPVEARIEVRVEVRVEPRVEAREWRQE
jgi:hypothetical protein